MKTAKQWAREKPARILQTSFDFAEAYADFHLKEYLKNTPQVIRVGDTNEFC